VPGVIAPSFPPWRIAIASLQSGQEYAIAPQRIAFKGHADTLLTGASLDSMAPYPGTMESWSGRECLQYVPCSQVLQSRGLHTQEERELSLTQSRHLPNVLDHRGVDDRLAARRAFMPHDLPSFGEAVHQLVASHEGSRPEEALPDSRSSSACLSLFVEIGPAGGVLAGPMKDLDRHVSVAPMMDGTAFFQSLKRFNDLGFG
jgi:hypothetical protein